jgi:hypothetical protein
MRIFQRFEARYHLSAHKRRELESKDTNFGTYLNHSAAEINSNSLNMCSCVMKCGTVLLETGGIYLLIEFISSVITVLIGLHHLLRSPSMEHFFY